MRRNGTPSGMGSGLPIPEPSGNCSSRDEAHFIEKPMASGHLPGAGFGPGHDESLLRPGHPDVEEPAGFFELGTRGSALGTRRDSQLRMAK